MRLTAAVMCMPLLAACTSGQPDSGNSPTPAPTVSPSESPSATPSTTPTPSPEPAAAVPETSAPAPSTTAPPKEKPRRYHYRFDSAGIPKAVCYDRGSDTVCQAWTPPPQSDWPEDPSSLVGPGGKVVDPNPRRTFPVPSPVRTIVRPTPTGPCPVGTQFSPRKGRCVTPCEEFAGSPGCRTPSTAATTRRAMATSSRR